jgi:SHS2 domain-containing protein
MIAARWEHFPHQADVGLRGLGATPAQAFEQAALALTAVVTETRLIRPREKVDIACEADNQELLLVDWLNALICEMDTRKMLFSRFEVVVADGRLKAKVWGEKLDGERHRPVVEVKAATYDELAVRQDRNGTWLVQCVVDV